MKYLPTNNPKIEKYLDESASEYKELLYKALINKTEDLDDLSVTTLIELDNEAKRPLYHSTKRDQQFKRNVDIMKIALRFSTMMLSMIAIVYLVYACMRSEMDYTIIISIIAVSLSTFSTILFDFLLKKPSSKIRNKIEKSTEDDKPLLMFTVINTWREFEGIANDLSTKNNIKSTLSVIETLYGKGYIDNSERVILRHLLKMRNDFVHDSTNQYSSEQIQEIINKVKPILQKIKEIV